MQLRTSYFLSLGLSELETVTRNVILNSKQKISDTS